MPGKLLRRTDCRFSRVSAQSTQASVFGVLATCCFVLISTGWSSAIAQQAPADNETAEVLGSGNSKVVFVPESDLISAKLDDFLPVKIKDLLKRFERQNGAGSSPPGSQNDAAEECLLTASFVNDTLVSTVSYVRFANGSLGTVTLPLFELALREPNLNASNVADDAKALRVATLSDGRIEMAVDGGKPNYFGWSAVPRNLVPATSTNGLETNRKMLAAEMKKTFQLGIPTALVSSVVLQVPKNVEVKSQTNLIRSLDGIPVGMSVDWFDSQDLDNVRWISIECGGQSECRFTIDSKRDSVSAVEKWIVEQQDSTYSFAGDHWGIETTFVVQRTFESLADLMFETSDLVVVDGVDVDSVPQTVSRMKQSTDSILGFRISGADEVSKTGLLSRITITGRAAIDPSLMLQGPQLGLDLPRLELMDSMVLTGSTTVRVSDGQAISKVESAGKLELLEATPSAHVFDWRGREPQSIVTIENKDQRPRLSRFAALEVGETEEKISSSFRVEQSFGNANLLTFDIADDWEILSIQSDKNPQVEFRVASQPNKSSLFVWLPSTGTTATTTVNPGGAKGAAVNNERNVITIVAIRRQRGVSSDSVSLDSIVLTPINAELVGSLLFIPSTSRYRLQPTNALLRSLVPSGDVPSWVQAKLPKESDSWLFQNDQKSTSVLNFLAQRTLFKASLLTHVFRRGQRYGLDIVAELRPTAGVFETVKLEVPTKIVDGLKWSVWQTDKWVSIEPLSTKTIAEESTLSIVSLPIFFNSNAARSRKLKASGDFARRTLTEVPRVALPNATETEERFWIDEQIDWIAERSQLPIQISSVASDSKAYLRDQFLKFPIGEFTTILLDPPPSHRENRKSSSPQTPEPSSELKRQSGGNAAALSLYASQLDNELVLLANGQRKMIVDATVVNWDGVPMSFAIDRTYSVLDVRLDGQLPEKQWLERQNELIVFPPSVSSESGQVYRVEITLLSPTSAISNTASFKIPSPRFAVLQQRTRMVLPKGYQPSRGTDSQGTAGARALLKSIPSWLFGTQFDNDRNRTVEISDVQQSSTVPATPANFSDNKPIAFDVAIERLDQYRFTAWWCIVAAVCGGLSIPSKLRWMALTLAMLTLASLPWLSMPWQQIVVVTWVAFAFGLGCRSVVERAKNIQFEESDSFQSLRGPTSKRFRRMASWLLLPIAIGHALTAAGLDIGSPRAFGQADSPRLGSGSDTSSESTEDLKTDTVYALGQASASTDWLGPIVFPVDSDEKIVGDYAYIWRNKYDALFEQRDNPSRTVCELLSANYRIRLPQIVVFGAPDSFAATIDVRSKSPESIFRFPIDPSLTRLERVRIDGVEVLNTSQVRIQDRGIEISFSDAEEHQVECEFRLLSLRDQLGMHDIALPIPKVLNAQFSLRASPKRATDVQIGSLGSVNRVSEELILADTGPADRLDLQWVDVRAADEVILSTEPIFELQTALRIDALGLVAATQLKAVPGSANLQGKVLEFDCTTDWQPLGIRWGEAELMEIVPSRSLTKNRYRVAMNSSSQTGVAPSIVIVWIPTNANAALLSLPRVTPIGATVQRESFVYGKQARSDWSIDGLETWSSNGQPIDTALSWIIPTSMKLQTLTPPDSPRPALLRKVLERRAQDQQAQTNVLITDDAIEFDSRFTVTGDPFLDRNLTLILPEGAKVQECRIDGVLLPISASANKTEGEKTTRTLQLPIGLNRTTSAIRLKLRTELGDSSGGEIALPQLDLPYSKTIAAKDRSASESAVHQVIVQQLVESQIELTWAGNVEESTEVSPEIESAASTGFRLTKLNGMVVVANRSFLAKTDSEQTTVASTNRALPLARWRTLPSQPVLQLVQSLVNRDGRWIAEVVAELEPATKADGQPNLSTNLPQAESAEPTTDNASSTKTIEGESVAGETVAGGGEVGITFGISSELAARIVTSCRTEVIAVPGESTSRVFIAARDRKSALKFEIPLAAQNDDEVSMPRLNFFNLPTEQIQWTVPKENLSVESEWISQDLKLIEQPRSTEDSQAAPAVFQIAGLNPSLKSASRKQESKSVPIAFLFRQDAREESRSGLAYTCVLVEPTTVGEIRIRSMLSQPNDPLVMVNGRIQNVVVENGEFVCRLAASDFPNVVEILGRHAGGDFIQLPDSSANSQSYKRFSITRFSQESVEERRNVRLGLADSWRDLMVRNQSNFGGRDSEEQRLILIGYRNALIQSVPNIGWQLQSRQRVGPTSTSNQTAESSLVNSMFDAFEPEILMSVFSVSNEMLSADRSSGEAFAIQDLSSRLDAKTDGATALAQESTRNLFRYWLNIASRSFFSLGILVLAGGILFRHRLEVLQRLLIEWHVWLMFLVAGLVHSSFYPTSLRGLALIVLSLVLKIALRVQWKSSRNAHEPKVSETIAE